MRFWGALKLRSRGNLIVAENSCGLSLKREIRCGGQQRSWQLSQIGPHQVYTTMANYYGSLEAVHFHIHSVRYDMALDRGAGSRPKLGLIRSPTTLYRRRYVEQMLEP
eukprot:scaffold37743_cov211-Skeletonema_marinoi.AAC.5